MALVACMAACSSGDGDDTRDAGTTTTLHEQLNGHGYLTAEITRDTTTVSLGLLDDVADAASAIETPSSWTVTAGSPEATKA